LRSDDGLDMTGVPQVTNFEWALGNASPSSRPRYIILGFQTARVDSQTACASVFDHCNIADAYVTLNSLGSKHPAIEYNTNFTLNKFT
jgi:hypothetical protein